MKDKANARLLAVQSVIQSVRILFLVLFVSACSPFYLCPHALFQTSIICIPPLLTHLLSASTGQFPAPTSIACHETVSGAGSTPLLKFYIYLFSFYTSIHPSLSCLFTPYPTCSLHVALVHPISCLCPLRSRHSAASWLVTASRRAWRPRTCCCTSVRVRAGGLGESEGKGTV